jgi:hypothetical protein
MLPAPAYFETRVIVSNSSKALRLRDLDAAAVPSAAGQLPMKTIYLKDQESMS